MKKNIVYLVLILSFALNVVILVFFGKTIYLESRKIVKQINNDNKTKSAANDFQYFNGLNFNVYGKFHEEENFSRLPNKYKNNVRSAVWNLSEKSSGISILFKTNSPDISIKWKVSKLSEYLNMSKVCTSGLDLYCFIENKWQYVNSGVPLDYKNEQLLISDMDTIPKVFLLNLPLYDGVEKIEIGIKNGFKISQDSDHFAFKKPIVFYGTSITQGGSASRPGLAYPSIISRNLNIETINLGFSNNGMFEKIVGNALCEIDASMYIIDCVLNSSPEVIKASAFELIMQIRNCKPKIPILLVEGVISEYSYFQKTDKSTFGGLEYIQEQNSELMNAYNNAIGNGMDNLYYLTNDGLIGNDHEGTIDGIHLNDLGMQRIANKIEQEIVKILELYKQKTPDNV